MGARSQEAEGAACEEGTDASPGDSRFSTGDDDLEILQDAEHVAARASQDDASPFHVVSATFTPIAMEGPLDVVAVRVLGSLIEKGITTPDNYPLTLSALTAACNQTSNRNPVLQVDEAAVSRSLEELGRRALVRGVDRGESRVRRYRHLLSETLHLHPPEIAVMCVLMLRGAQTAGEIRTRTARLFEFTDVAQVDVTLQGLMTLSVPLVAQLPRRPGQKEVRYAHLLSGEPQVDTSEPSSEERVGSSRLETLEQAVDSLRAEMTELRAQFEEFRQAFQ